MNNKKSILIIEREEVIPNKLSKKQLSKVIGGNLDCGTFGTCAPIFSGNCKEFDESKCYNWH